MFLEIAANASMALSVVLAGRNSIHTWWAGMVACVLFALLFFDARLYADASLQIFYLATSAVGWWLWRHRARHPASDLAQGRRGPLLAAAAAGVLGALAYGSLLQARTDAYAPHADALVMMFSMIAQILLMRRRVESWWFWIVVDVIAIPLFASRGLHITALLYAGYLLNAVLALRYWRALARHGEAA